MTRVRRTAIALAGAVVVALAVPGAGGAQSGTTLSAGMGEASGIYVRVNDPSIFLEETILAPPEAHVSYARAGLERTGTGVALAANGYSEYVNVLGAFPELGPAFLPPEALPVFQLLLTVLPPGLAESARNLTQASVRGAPPQERDATYFPGTSAEGGVMRASITDGPTARAVSTFADFPVSLLVRASSIDTETVVSTASVGRRVDVTSVLRDVTIAEILEIDSIRVTAVANANGGDGVGEGSVTIDGVTVAGLPAVIDQDGLRLADEVVPLSVGPISDLLESAGITLTAPGAVTTDTSGEEVSVAAAGPTIDLLTPEGQQVRLTLGRAVAISDLVTLPAPPAPGVTTPPPGTPSGPSTAGPPVGSGALPSFDVPAQTPDGSPPPAVASDPVAIHRLDIEPLVLASEEARRGIEDVYAMLLIPVFLLAVMGVSRPWRTD